ncbi:tetratricopeptide repeat protein [Chitinophaga nivalis]|uniref:YaiO family outer membrane beta-barrel protein n=1 Tax=Chitinophaga nivalis TaxID=2991709 RepID=A0ABT3IQ76_9BACT|nr:tetratricopeptide repeat protein [Chitinophaga nivalis]MCW3464187.1 YaiO family outer membrane beta-barrel protein [Chitinophaga nivalis]MCW3486123.1 YaiO family outer membrane beta-barrel protein [Chitinophaga nivalis]
MFKCSVKNIFIALAFLLAGTATYAQRSGLVSSDVLYKLALDARKENKDYVKAIRLCKKALSQSPDYTDVRILLGRLYQETGQPVAAAFEWNVVLRKEPGNTEVLQALVNLYDSQGNPAEAICYVDMLLEKSPLDKNLLLKKYGMVTAGGDVVTQARLMALLRLHYASDPQVAALLKDYQLQAARQGRSAGNTDGAQRMYEQVLLREPDNRDALEGLAAALESQGRAQEAITYYDRLLHLFPDNTTYRLKRSAMQLTARNYTAALEDAQWLYRHHKEQPQFKQHLTDVYMAMVQQPGGAPAYAEQLLALQPRNKGAYEQLINHAYGKGDYTTANSWCNKALQVFPGDAELLKKQVGIQEAMPDYPAATRTALQLLQRYPGSVETQRYSGLQLAYANKLIREQQVTQAVAVLQSALQQVPGEPSLTLLLSNMHALQGHPREAVALLDQLLAKQPADTALLYKKSGLLESMQDYRTAAGVTRQLHTAYPADLRYRRTLADQLLGAARQDIQQQQYPAAKAALQEILQFMPAEKAAWVYLINLENQQGQPQQALTYTTDALHTLAADSLLLQKKAALLQQLGRYTDAGVIAAQLYQRYPADTALRQLYLEQLLAQGKQCREKQQWDSAWQYYQTAYAVAPADTTVLTYLTTTATARKQYDTTLMYADKGLALWPAQPVLLAQKAHALEQLHRYADAAGVARQLYAIQPGEKKWREYADHLNGYTYKNQAGVIYMQSVYDKNQQPASIVSLQYMRRHQRGTVLGRVNYATREAGSGIQLEAETYYTHNPRYYSYGLIGWSDAKVFPLFRAGYSLFRNFNKGWEGEVGARYIRSDTSNNYSAVFSVGKYFGNYWANLRAFYTHDEQQWYQAYTLTNRFYLNDRQDFIALIGNIGASPDDRSRNFQFGNVVGFTSTSLTAGFQKNVRSRATIGAYTTWTRQQIAKQQYGNQYDAYLLFLWNF